MFVAYLPALRGDFLLSDNNVIVKNPRLTAEDGLRRIWFSTEAAQYQPLIQTSYWLERRVWGLRPWGYHLFNLVLHMANGVLVWMLLDRIGVRGAALAAVIFVLHPVNVESVAWIYERKNVLSGLFYFLTFAAFLRFEKGCGGRWYAMALLLFVAALLAKASTVVLPAVLLLYWWWRGTLWQRRNLVAVIPFVFLAGLMAALTIWYEQHYTGAVGAEYSAGLAERFARAGWIVLFYLGKTLVPYNLTFFYSRWSVDPSSLWSYLPHGFLIIILIVSLARRHTWGRSVLFGLGYFVVALVPVLGFFNIYYHRHSLVADHFQYLGIVGLIALCVHALTCGLDRCGLLRTDPVSGRPKFGGREVGILLVALCWFMTWQRAQVYQNTRMLCEDTLRRNPDSWVAHHKLGEYILRHGVGHRNQLLIALNHFRKADQLRPDHAPILGALGAALQSLQRGDEAMGCLRRAIALDPDQPTIRFNLGTLLAQRGESEAAIIQFEEAARSGPGLSIVRGRLGQALVRVGRSEEGIEHLRAAVELRPDAFTHHLALGRALWKAGQFEEAIAHLKEATRLNPGDSRAAVALKNMQRSRQGASTPPPGVSP